MDGEFKLHPQLERDTLFIGSLQICDILLVNDSRYPWVILVPRISDVSDITDLSEKQRVQFNEEINHVASLMKRQYQPERMNIAMLGNLVPQLHCHVIARFTTDFAWAKPVWGIDEAIPYPNEQSLKTIQILRRLFI